MGDHPSFSGVAPDCSGTSYPRTSFFCQAVARAFNICPVGIGIRSHPADPSVHAYADVSDGKNEKRFERK